MVAVVAVVAAVAVLAVVAAVAVPVGAVKSMERWVIEIHVTSI